MPVLDNLKNFIRHGKAARDSPHAQSAAEGPSHTASRHEGPGAGVGSQEPTAPIGTGVHAGNAANAELGYNVPAKPVPAMTVSTHASAPGQTSAPAERAPTQAPHAAPSASKQPSFQADGSQYHKEAQQIVEEERQAKEKMPYYEGLSERFQLVMKMGDGAFSNVYKAIDRETGQKVAVKVVRKYELNSNQNDGRLDPQFRKKNRVTERANILKEVQIMRNLKHPGIVELLSFSESNDYYFLVLELLEGGELFHQIVKLTYFSEPLSRHVILQVAHGIRYLHEESGVVHRDIKPENLLFESIQIIPSKVPKARQYDEDKEDEGEYMPGIGGGGIGRVKIADFGLSKVVWDESTMTPCGTVGYTAPEIVKDERYSKSVDMWALGCVLYTLLCGFPPFYDESISVLTEKVAKGYYTFLSPWWDDISDSAKDLITHLLCVDANKRYTIDEFLAHPWCNEKDSVPLLNSADIALAKASEMPLDSPLLHSMKGGNGQRVPLKSPGVAQLKEAFDVSYAVHRMEEEGARRRAYNGPGGAGQAGLLHGLNEEDEDEDEAEQTRIKYGAEAGKAVENQRGARAEPGHKAGGSTAPAHRSQAATATSQQPQGQQYQGRGGADRRLAEAALYEGGRAGQRDRGSAGRKRGFELNMGNATLLGRRSKAQGGPGGLMLDAHGNPIVDGATAAGVVPGSPMRVD